MWDTFPLLQGNSPCIPVLGLPLRPLSPCDFLFSRSHLCLLLPLPLRGVTLGQVQRYFGPSRFEDREGEGRKGLLHSSWDSLMNGVLFRRVDRFLRTVQCISTGIGNSNQ